MRKVLFGQPLANIKSPKETVVAAPAGHTRPHPQQPQPQPCVNMCVLIIHFVHLQNRMPTTRRYSCDFVLMSDAAGLTRTQTSSTPSASAPRFRNLPHATTATTTSMSSRPSGWELNDLQRWLDVELAEKGRSADILFCVATPAGSSSPRAFQTFERKCAWQVSKNIVNFLASTVGAPTDSPWSTN